MSKDVSGFGHMVLVTNKSSVAIIIAYLFSLAYFYQCYKYRVGEYIAEGPKRNYRIYRRKCRQTSAIYRQNKKYKNIKKYKNAKNHKYSIKSAILAIK